MWLYLYFFRKIFLTRSAVSKIEAFCHATDVHMKNTNLIAQIVIKVVRWNRILLLNVFCIHILITNKFDYIMSKFLILKISGSWTTKIINACEKSRGQVKYRCRIAYRKSRYMEILQIKIVVQLFREKIYWKQWWTFKFGIIIILQHAQMTFKKQLS